MRPLNDRIAEAMRRERLGNAGPHWSQFTDEQKADWLRRADEFRRLCTELGVFVAIRGEGRNGRIS